MRTCNAWRSEQVPQLVQEVYPHVLLHSARCTACSGRCRTSAGGADSMPHLLVVRSADCLCRSAHTSVALHSYRYRSSDPLDLGEALWLSHWALPEGEAWAELVSEVRTQALRCRCRWCCNHCTSAGAAAAVAATVTAATAASPLMQVSARKQLRCHLLLCSAPRPHWTTCGAAAASGRYPAGSHLQ